MSEIGNHKLCFSTQTVMKQKFVSLLSFHVMRDEGCAL